MKTSLNATSNEKSQVQRMASHKRPYWFDTVTKGQGALCHFPEAQHLLGSNPVWELSPIVRPSSSRKVSASDHHRAGRLPPGPHSFWKPCTAAGPCHVLWQQQLFNGRTDFRLQLRASKLAQECVGFPKKASPSTSRYVVRA